MDTTNHYDESGGYEIELWVEADKSLEEFERCLAGVIHPLPIENHQFRLGGIGGSIHRVKDAAQVPDFAGVAKVGYSYCIAIQKVDYDLWGRIDHHFLFAIAWGLRSKFSCCFLITADGDFFIAQAGTNSPTTINTCYAPWASGELAARPFRERVSAS